MKHAFIFPGQGSQTVGMLSELANSFPIVKQTFEQASTILGYDLWQLSQAGPEAILNQTDKTQPALLAASVAVWRVWKQQGGRDPDVMAGHSFGNILP
ncbi:MAG: acyltransferase domain-containing protein [Thiotrichaceae bacterium]